MSPRALAVALVALAGGGCTLYHAADHCDGCALVEEGAPRLPAARPGRDHVVLVPGAFGFGDEWRETVARLRARGLDFTVFWWRGPWSGMDRPAARLAAVLDAVARRAGDGGRVLVLAHSAGGALAEHVAARLDVPPHRMRVASIDGPRGLDGWPFFVHEAPPPRPVGARPAVVAFVARGAPPGSPRAGVVFLGPVDHNAAVALVALPLVDELAGARLAARAEPAGVDRAGAGAAVDALR